MAGQYEQAAPKRSLGQNFLRDENIARNIVAALEIGPDDCVLEIGPGRGALTKHITALGPKRFMVLEKDDALAEALSHWDNAPEVWRGDALKFPWESLDTEGAWKIVGNLPYNIASPLMWEIVSRARFDRAVFMIQLEVAQRIKAEQGGKVYGALSAWIQNFTSVELLFKVPPHVFFPPPKVTSGVIRLKPKKNLPDAPGAKALAALLHCCFQNRRKQIGNILKSKGIANYVEALEALGITPAQRPETLEPERFLALAKLLSFHFLP